MTIYHLRSPDDASYRLAASVSVPRSDTEVAPYIFNTGYDLQYVTSRSRILPTHLGSCGAVIVSYDHFSFPS